MEWLHFLFTTLSFLGLLIVSSSIYVLSGRFRIPYTVALVAVWLLIGAVSPHVPWLGFLDDFTLTPEILLYVFLPVLLFESAYNMRFRDLLANIGSISLLAIASLFISALCIGAGLYWVFDFFGMHIPFMVALLFGSLISATDPVSVLALFKELGAPKRLTLIFEGESLFNDGTALALFLVILSFFQMDSSHGNLFIHMMTHFSHVFHMDLRVLTGVFSFILMVFGGIFFGGLIGVIFSRSIPFFGRNKILELALTIVLAHLTFILADLVNHFLFPLSWVIATTIAALVVGNYGRYKLSHDTRMTMGEYWEFFAHISNSIVFLLVWVMIFTLDIAWETMILPIILAIIVVMISRAISVYGVVIPWNTAKKEAPIPTSWMHLLSWWSLRGALAIVMALLIPSELLMQWWWQEISLQSFILALTVGSIIFTTFIKATTIVPLIKELHIDQLTEEDRLTFIESKLLFLLGVKKRIEHLGGKWYFHIDQQNKLVNHYKDAVDDVSREFEKILTKSENSSKENLLRVISLFALQRERTFLIDLFSHGEIDEILLRYQLEKINGQIDRIENGKSQLKNEIEKATVLPFTARTMILWMKFFETTRYKKYEHEYLKHRTRVIMLEKVLEQLEVFHELPIIAKQDALVQVIDLYTRLLETAVKKRDALREEHPSILWLEAKIIHQTILKQEWEEIHEMIEHEVISKKIWSKLLAEI